MKIDNKIFILLFMLFINPLYSEENSEKQKYDFSFSAGTKGIYSSGISDQYIYDKSNITGELKTEYVDASASFLRYFNYQLTDGNDNYEYRSFYEAGLSITAHLFELISLTVGYSHADDFNDLSGNVYSGGIELEISPVILTGDYSYEKFEYLANSENIETNKNDFSCQLEYAFSNFLSSDLGYSYSGIYFNSLGYSYDKNSFRAGLSLMPAEYIFFIAGAGIGKDSADYYIFGADCAIAVKIFTRFKITLAYNIAYYYPPDGTSDTSGSKGKYGNGSGNDNPYLSTDKIGDPYYSQVVSLGMSVSF